MKRFHLIVLCLVGILLAVACERDNNGGKHESELPINSCSISGEATKLQSVAVEMLDDNIYIVATPTPNIATATEIFGCEEYLFVAVNPLLVGKEFDLKTESSLYTIISTLSDAPLREVTPENNGEVKVGTIKFAYENNVATVKGAITLANGKEFKFHLSAEKAIAVNENIITRGDETKPLRAAFYDEGDFATTLYFTPAGLDYFEEIEDASWYIYLGVSNKLVDGKSHSLAEMGGTSMFEFGMIDNIRSDNSMEIMAGFLREGTGSFAISKSGNDSYVATISITILDVLYTVEFEGKCISVDYAPEKKTNFFSYKGTEYEALSAVLTQGESLWSVEIATSRGKSVVLNAPKEFFNSGDGGRGFSQSAGFTVEYNGVVYSKANGYSGTMISSYDETKQHLEIDFFNNSDVKFSYTGAVTIK